MKEQSNEEEALRRIREAKDEAKAQQLTTLDLQGCNLSKLPAELASLSNLPVLMLKLNHNQIVDLTPLVSLSNLLILYLE
jgi:Leucine-rich repeat (LRR) protein